MRATDEAYAEAERRYPARNIAYVESWQDAEDKRDAFVAGAGWQASRSPGVEGQAELDAVPVDSRAGLEPSAAVRAGGPIAAAVNARLDYDINHNLAGAWIDAENKLTDAQFLDYQRAYQQRSRNNG